MFDLSILNYQVLVDRHWLPVFDRQLRRDSRDAKLNQLTFAITSSRSVATIAAMHKTPHQPWYS